VKRSQAPFHRMIVMNRLSTENMFEDLDGLAAVEVADDQQLVCDRPPPGRSLSRCRSPRSCL
jgi:hypothetical protein